MGYFVVANCDEDFTGKHFELVGHRKLVRVCVFVCVCVCACVLCVW
jgi:hypothetical protein